MSNRNYTPLDKYERYKKKLIPPLAQLDIKMMSWADCDLPEMLWAALSACAMPRDDYLSLFRKVSRLCQSYPEIEDITITGISLCSAEKRIQFLDELLALDERLRPILTPLLLFKELPGLEEWRRVIPSKADQKDGIVLAVAINYAVENNERATDLQWLRLICFSTKIYSTESSISPEEIEKYPDCEDYDRTGSTIRAWWNCMRGIRMHSDWSNTFWQQCRENTHCWTRHEQSYVSKIERDKKKIQNLLNDWQIFTETRDTLRQHFFSSQKNADQDVRHQMVFGLAFYALDVFAANVLYRSALTIVGRVNLRMLLEAYFNLAYMLHEEKNDPNIWSKYRDYGSGRFVSIYKKLGDAGRRPPRLLDAPLIESIANEDQWDELIEINYGSWHGKKLSEISEEVEQKELYDQYYEYLSEYMHAGWGAVRQSSMKKCRNILHRGHIIPSDKMMLQLSNVTDCKRMMNKVLGLVNKAYPGLEVRF